MLLDHLGRPVPRPSDKHIAVISAQLEATRPFIADMFDQYAQFSSMLPPRLYDSRGNQLASTLPPTTIGTTGWRVPFTTK